MSRQCKLRDLKLLWGFSAARCAFPDCFAELVEEATDVDRAAVVGEIAHICGLNAGSARFDSSIPVADRNRYANLILLCPTHHTIVDKQGNTYTADDLRSWKGELEQTIRNHLQQAVPAVGFAELEIVTKGLLARSSSSTTEDFELLDPTEKMARNSLESDAVRFELTMGLSKAREVELFVDDIAKTAPSFPEDLKQGFLAEYRRLQSDGHDGEVLYFALRDFATTRTHDFSRRAAGLSVLAYLFEKCEVFER